jgi:hypothetical protein
MSCLFPQPGHEGDARDWTVDEVAQFDEFRNEEAAAEATATAASPLATVARQRVSGTYRGGASSLQIELRVDVDGVHPLKRVSGDLYKVAGGTVTYFGSFVVDAPTLQVTSSSVTVKGIGNFTFTTTTPFVTVTIRRVPLAAPLAPAILSFSSAAGASGTSYTCQFAMRAFRVVQWEQDSIEGTIPFESYDVALLPSGGRPRLLTIPSAYAEAGIEVQVSGVSNIFKPDTSIGSTWSDAELHAAMVDHFSLLSDDPQWRVWLLVATSHDIAGVRGIMFDRIGRHRQGCAVFHDLVKGDTAQAKRAALRTYVHELGHCFNLLHSWQKSLAVPPQPDRLDALSYMNYVQNFPGGESAYWAAFPFQFDDPEVVHLRHGFRNNVIMGGSDFATGAADIDELMVSRPVVDNSGLELRLEGKQRYALSEPVVVDLRLASFDTRGRQAHEQIHPNHGYVRIVVREPGGNLVLFRPIADRCIEGTIVSLVPGKPLYTSAYIGYGKDGFTFRQPGFYDVRAIYQAPDGSDVVSNVLRVRVGSPQSKEDDEIADLYFGEDQGKLFTFLGSDAPSLDSGNRALDEVLTRFPQHPLSAYAALVKGINAKRQFKVVTPERTVKARNPQLDEAIAFLGSANRPDTRLDNLTVNKAMRELATAQAASGDTNAASETLAAMIRYFRAKELKPEVIAKIQERAEKAAESFEKYR